MPSLELKTLLFLAVLTFVSSFCSKAEARPSYQVLGYALQTTEAPSSSVTDSGQGTAINWSTDVPWTDLTMVSDAFLQPTTSDTFKNQGAKGTTLITAAHNNGCRCIVSLGGSGQDGAFKTLCNSATNITNFTAAVTAMVMTDGYDGVDIDWETVTNQQAAATSMMESLYAGLKALPNCSVDGKPHTLSFTTNPGYSTIFNMTTLANYSDWCFFMGYDWYENPTTNANGPLSVTASDTSAGVPSISGTILGMTNGTQWSYPINKMMLGCPLYTNDYPADSGNGMEIDTLSILHLGSAGSYSVTYAEQSYTNPSTGDQVYVDTQQSYCDKVNWAIGHGLMGIGMWDMGQGLPSADTDMAPIWSVIGGNSSCLTVIGSTATPTNTQTMTPTTGNTATRTMTPTSTVVANTATYTSTLTVTHTSTTAATSTYTSTSTLTQTHTATALPATATSTSTVTLTHTNTVLASTNTSTATLTASSTQTTTPTFSSTTTGTLPPSSTYTNTLTSTATLLATSTSTQSATATAPASTATKTSTLTETQTVPVVNTATPTPTASMTFTTIINNSPTPTQTVTSTVTNSMTPTVTNSSTFVFTATNTASATVTNSPVFTATPTSTWSLTPTFTFTPALTNCPGVSSWSANSVSYRIGQEVGYNGQLYECIQSVVSTSGNTPPVAGSYWQDLGPCGSTPTVVVQMTPVIYPNPVTSGTATLQLSTNDPSGVKIRIYTISFREVQTLQYAQVNGNTLSISLVDRSGMPLANGLYYFVIQIGSSRWVDKVLVLR